jgi:hypothetical protein
MHCPKYDRTLNLLDLVDTSCVDRVYIISMPSRQQRANRKIHGSVEYNNKESTSRWLIETQGIKFALLGEDSQCARAVNEMLSHERKDRTVSLVAVFTKDNAVRFSALAKHLTYIGDKLLWLLMRGEMSAALPLRLEHDAPGQAGPARIPGQKKGFSRVM